MNWDEKPLEAGSRLRHRQETIHDAATRAAYLEGWLDAGSEIRSDDAVERVAQFMWSERAKGTVHPHYPWTGLAPHLRDGLRQDARATINALLGEEET